MVFFILGLFGSVMLVLIPVWDGMSLLRDPMWMYMNGDVLPKALILCAMSIPALFALTAIMLRMCGRRSAGAHTEQTMISAVVLFVLLLGAMLVTIAEPITQQANSAKTEFLVNCKTGHKTQPLYKEYTALQSLRSTEACASKGSVEECEGFNATSSSTTLKQFEESMQCSGFCYYPDLKATTDFYPPALFTTQKLQGSCSAMAGRNMESFVSDMSRQLSLQGFFLIAASIVQGFMMLLSPMAKKEAPKKAGYGTLQVRTGMVPPTDATIESGSADIRRRQGY